MLRPSRGDVGQVWRLALQGRNRPFCRKTCVSGQPRGAVSLQPQGPEACRQCSFSIALRPVLHLCLERLPPPSSQTMHSAPGSLLVAPPGLPMLSEADHGHLVNLWFRF